VHVIDASRLACEVRRGRSDVLGICAALEAGKAKEAEDFISDGEAIYTRGDGRDDARHVSPRDGGQAQRRPHLRRHVGHPLAHVPVGGIDANRVNPNEHLTRLRLGNRHLVVTQHLRTTELVQLNRLHRVCRHRVRLFTADGLCLLEQCSELYGALLRCGN